jgi:hypothetical protein
MSNSKELSASTQRLRGIKAIKAFAGWAPPPSLACRAPRQQEVASSKPAAEKSLTCHRIAKADLCKHRHIKTSFACKMRGCVYVHNSRGGYSKWWQRSAKLIFCDAPALLAKAGAVTKGSQFTVRASTLCKLAIDLVPILPKVTNICSFYHKLST